MRIDTTEALSAYNKKQFHHVFPKGFLKRIKAGGEHNSLVNICMLSASENNRISDSDPNKYLPESIVALATEANAVFASNLMPVPTAVDYSSLDYEGLLDRRVIMLRQAINSLCEGEKF